jgi:hypothetical protein
MLVFNYMIRLYNQDVSIIAAPATAKSAKELAIDLRGSAGPESATE